jgi:hypothetical protein
MNDKIKLLPTEQLFAVTYTVTFTYFTPPSAKPDIKKR